MADNFIPVPGGSNNNNYANVPLIVEIAERTNSKAVWAGWGHASENPLLPDTLEEHGIIFIGPPGSAMRSLGDKIASSIVAQSVDVPTLPWNGSHLKIDTDDPTIWNGKVINLSEEMYDAGKVFTAEQGLEAANTIGYPVMIKASEGGGGKGIRRVNTADEFVTMYDQVMGELPGSPIFVMKLAENVRHLEVQLLADKYGRAISLFSRDCSVQRRHQKIIEEAPATTGTQQDFRNMEKAAVRLAELVGYVSAGTVEYLFSEEDGFYFLELNPRLQVEHPCTEIVSDINLPSLQLQVAMGLPLHCMSDIRVLYGYDKWGTSNINFDEPEHVPTPKGHVIAARITAENPDEGFKPTSGKMEALNFRSSPNVWGYFSVTPSGGVHEYADSQFGHIFAWGETREQARYNLVVVLKDISIRGDFRTTVEYLIKLMETSDFKENKIHTGWLDRLISERITPDRPNVLEAVICSSLQIAYTHIESTIFVYTRALERGQVFGKDHLNLSTTCELIYQGVKYITQTTKIGKNSYIVELNGTYVTVNMHKLTDGGKLVSFKNKSIVTYYKEFVDKYRVNLDGKTLVFQKENDPTILRSSSPGKLVRYLIPDGEHVNRGESFAEVEVMKMFLTIQAEESGILSHKMRAGDVLEAGDIIATLDLDDPNLVTPVILYEDGFSDNLSFSQSEGTKVHKLFENSLQWFNNILDGYKPPAGLFLLELKHNINLLKKTVIDPNMPLYELRDVLSPLTGRIPPEMYTQIMDLLGEYARGLGSMFCSFPTQAIATIIDEHTASLERANKEQERDQFFAVIEPVVHLIQRYRKGLRGHTKSVLVRLLNRYLDVELPFNNDMDESRIINSLKEEKSDVNEVFEIALAHFSTSYRMDVILELITWLSTDTIGDEEVSILEGFASLRNSKAAPIALKARKILLESKLPSFERRKLDMEILLASCIESLDAPTRLKDLVNRPDTYFDILSSFFYHAQPRMKLAALEVYVQRAYSAYNLKKICHWIMTSGEEVLTWTFLRPRGDPKPRTGVLVSYDSLEDVQVGLHDLLSSKQFPPSPEHENILQVALQNLGHTNDELCSDILRDFISTNAETFHSHGIKRVTFMIVRFKLAPAYFTYRESLDYQEDKTYRHLEPGLAYQLELFRLQSYDDIRFLPTENIDQHLYFCEAKQDKSAIDRRFFVRSIVHHCDLVSEEESLDYWMMEGEQQLVNALASLDLVVHDPSYGPTDCNHLFLNFLPTITLDPYIIKSNIWKLLSKHGSHLWKLRVLEGELKANVRPAPEEPVMTIRWFIVNSAGFLQPNALQMYEERNVDGKITLIPMKDDDDDEIHVDRDVSSPYITRNLLQSKRYFAQSRGTSYVYDLPDFFNQAVLTQWKKQQGGWVPSVFTNFVELIVNEDGKLVEIQRQPGKNTISIVAWKITLFTPEYPNGRDIILIANDLTNNIGSFAPGEDELFQKASELARKLGIPRIYISVNSGARIGLAEEIKNTFRVAWKDPNNPAIGFDYLYMTPEDYKSYKHSVVAKLITVDGEHRYKISDIIGETDGLGVENLRGSGMIAGETSLAYEETFTISMVTCRSVGIGAYLVRLGQRVIQVDTSNIILTGAHALNKVLGRQVYTSNMQLGGPLIMYNNGVSDICVKNDLSGVIAIVDWLSYIPESRSSPLPIIEELRDPIERNIDYIPGPQPYDPREMLAGVEVGGNWVSGFFDKGSWMETLGGWANTVVTGRARLGGIPIGVIAVETRTVEFCVPPDPAFPDTEAKVVQQAGQVWFPDSAFKTSQTITDVNNEQLPLMIFANWRGFSGGTKDMYDEVLKFGAYIVDGLREFQQPVFVYIPPHGELRGGAWVVVDPTINIDMMEMYCDELGEGGVLEADGTVEIKFRLRDLRKTMIRLDDEYRELHERLENGEDVLEQVAIREKLLLPIYRQVSLNFAKLHDTPGRMKAKGVITDVLEWRKSRTFFAKRLLRRIISEDIIKNIQSADRSFSHSRASSTLRRWFHETEGAYTDWSNDETFIEWSNHHQAGIQQNIEAIRESTLIEQIREAAEGDTNVAYSAISRLCQFLTDSQREQLRDSLM
eukprot:TRINITY_DN5356_c0_g1_i1.p1 TRINITY_DN5356_c0_g1~~TRINITY_DN5356_c0_g1_i1.p1  ORF type:complete len:2154 (+),score=572.60 TRINITY_DN5356_c0_g1_i1:253-6462(+)